MRTTYSAIFLIALISYTAAYSSQSQNFLSASEGPAPQGDGCKCFANEDNFKGECEGHGFTEVSCGGMANCHWGCPPPCKDACPREAQCEKKCAMCEKGWKDPACPKDCEAKCGACYKCHMDFQKAMEKKMHEEMQANGGMAAPATAPALSKQFNQDPCASSCVKPGT